MIYKVGMLCKFKKGKELVEKNIYRIEKVNVKGSEIDTNEVTYSGKRDMMAADDLVQYENIFENKKFCREYSDISQELSDEEKEEYNQDIVVQPLTPEEIDIVQSEEFIEKKRNLKR